MRTARLAALLLLPVFTACAERSADAAADRQAIATDSSRLSVAGGEIWYRVVGTGEGLPVVLLHGGPGMSSYYLKPMEALGEDRVVVRYDQLGSGKSDVVSDTTMFTIGHFVAELDSLRSHLGLERMHLYGHSWGTNLAVEYYRAHPDHVASMVLASDALDIPAWARHAAQLLTTWCAAPSPPTWTACCRPRTTGSTATCGGRASSPSRARSRTTTPPRS